MDGGNSYQQMESYSTVGGGENYSQMKGANHQQADGGYSQAEGSHGYEVMETSGQMSADMTSGTGQGTESRIQNQPSRAQNYNQGGKQQTGKRQQEQTFERKRPRDRSPTNIPYQRRRLEGPPDFYGPEARRRPPFHRSPSPPFPPYDLPPYDPYRRPITPPFDLPPYPPFRRSPSPPFGRPVFPRFRRSPSPPFDLPPGPIRRYRPLPPEFPPYVKPHFPERRPPHSPARPQSQDFSDEVSLLRADGMDSGGKSFGRGKNFNNYQRGSDYRGRRGEYHTERSQRGQTNRGRGFQAGDRGFSRGRGRGTQDTRGRGGSTRGSNYSRGGATQTSTRGSYNQGGSQGGAGSTNQRGAQRGSRGGQRGSRGGQRGVRGTRGAFRGRGGNNLQPSYNKVHSLANVQKPDVKHMSVAEKLHRLGLFLKSDAPGLQINSIQAIENSLLASKLQMKSHYEAMELMKVGGKAMYTGCLYIGGQFIIRSVGPSKKELKHDVYTQALYILTNNSMVDILGRQDRPDELRQSLIESLQQQEQEQQRLAAINPAPVEKNAVSITADPKYQIPCDFNSSVQILMDYLKTKDVFMTNSISGLEEAITASHCLLKTSMTFEESKSSNKSIFRVLLKLGETPVAVGHAPKKKEAKHIAYKNALTALRTRTVDDLADGINPLEGSEPDEGFYKQLLSASSQQSNKTSKKGKLKEAVDGFNLEKQFAKLIDGLKDASFQKNNIPAVDCMAIHLGIHPVSVYRKAEYSENQEPTIACDLYMQDVFVATSESHTKKDAQAETYQKAWDLLLTTPVDKLLQDQPRGPPPDMSDPAVFDVVHKGDGKHGFSNMDRLKQLRIDVYENWKSVDELVIVEHSDWVSDRERHAFCILNQSATKSGLLMEWAIVPTQEERVTFLCTIFLQKQEMGLAKSVTKLRARNLASIIVLNKLYQTQPIIQVLRMDDSKSWITWEEIEEKVKMWIPPTGYVSSLKLLDSPPTDTPLTFSPKVVRYCVYLLDTLLERKTLDVLKFGPGMPKPESRAITNHALQLGLKVEVLQHQGISYMLIGKKLPPSDMVDILRCHNNASGRHLLLMDSQRPTLNITDFPKD